VTPEETAWATGWPDDPGRAERIVGELLDEGLVVRDGGGVLHLP
jgi:hypothetical protein